MLGEQDLKIREAKKQEDDLIARHFYQMWLDNDVLRQSIQYNWLEITLKFIESARQELCYKAFVAEIDGEVVGSAGCQLFAGLYPQVIAEEVRRYGYIWGVYVELPYRGQGIAKKLTARTVDYLKLPSIHFAGLLKL